MRDLQILILNLQGNQLGELDLTDSDDFALKLTKSLASINDLGRRNTSFSLDFEAPQTKNNNKLLAGLRFVGATKEILGQKPCSILVDGNQVDKGFLYPYESKVDGMYTLVFRGQNNDWVEQLRDVELNELEWRDYNTGLLDEDATELFSTSRIATVNAVNSDTADVIYPYMNRNNAGAAADRRPQLHIRSVILRMFEKIGYTISSAWLESDWVKGLQGTALQYDDAYGNKYDHLGLSLDPAFQLAREQQDLIGQSIEYKAPLDTASTDPNAWSPVTTMGNLGTPSSPNQRNLYRFPTVLSTVITDDGARFNTATSEFTVGIAGTYALDFNFLFDYGWYDTAPFGGWNYYNYGSVSPFVQRPPNFKWYVVKDNTADTLIDGTIIYQGSIAPNPQGNIQSLTQFHSFGTGDKISVFLELEDNSFGFTPSYLNAPNALQYWRLRIKDDSVLRIVPEKNVKLGDVYRINSHIPDGIKCLELLQDFKTMFNLYFDVDVNRKVVTIEPRDDFYTGTAQDVTDKVDHNTEASINYLTSYKNEIVFKYADDSKDKYLDQWNKINNKTYAEYTYLLQNNERFDKGQSTLTTNLISATIQGVLNNTGNDIMSSIIKEEYLDADNVAKPVNKNYGIRVFQLVRGQQYDSAGVSRRTNAPFTVLCGIMEDYGNTPTMNDNRLTFVGTNGLVERYYAKTLANIEDTAVITLKMNLTLYDYVMWDLRRTYYISEPAELKGYYITDKISNFNVTKEQTTTVTLVKFKDYEPVATQGGIGNTNIITENEPEPQPILCTVNGVIVDCLDNNFQQMFKI